MVRRARPAQICPGNLKKPFRLSLRNMENRPMHSFRLIATDLDGTLLRRDGTISQRTIEALQRVRGAGMIVVLVSARPPRILCRIAREAGIGGLALCCNGA